MRVRSEVVFGLALSILALAATGVSTSLAQATYRLTVDPQLSLAWWQVNPHLNHLWATTCPADPSWRPGDGGRSVAWAQQFLTSRSKTGYANVKDTVIPLYPRRRVRPLCEEAISGEITTSDTLSWRDVRGSVTLIAEKLTTGMNMRDNYAKKSVLNTSAYPNIRFTIDSLGPLTKTRGDTLRGTVYGVFFLHGAQKPMEAGVRSWREPGGQRVLAKFMIPAGDMIDVYKMSQYSLGLGVGQLVWQELWLGIDVIFRSASP